MICAAFVKCSQVDVFGDDLIIVRALIATSGVVFTIFSMVVFVLFNGHLLTRRFVYGLECAVYGPI